MPFQWIIALVLAMGSAIVGFEIWPYAQAYGFTQAVGVTNSMIDSLHDLAHEPGAASGGNQVAIGGATLTYDGKTLRLYQGMPVSLGSSGGNASYVESGAERPLSYPIKLFVNGAAFSAPWSIVENAQGLMMPVSGIVSVGSLGTTFPATCKTLTVTSGLNKAANPGDSRVNCATGTVDPSSAAATQGG